MSGALLLAVVAVFGTVALIVGGLAYYFLTEMAPERRRLAHEDDGLLWFCENCNHKVYEEYFHLHDIEKDFPPVFERFYSSLAHRTCDKCGHLNPAPSRYVMPDT